MAAMAVEQPAYGQEKEAQGEIKTEHTGYLGTQDTYYVGTLKGVQQTFMDTYTKVEFVKLYDRKNALVAADMLNDRGLPFFEEEGVRLNRRRNRNPQDSCV